MGKTMSYAEISMSSLAAPAVDMSISLPNVLKKQDGALQR
jgi:hypothetical protein